MPKIETYNADGDLVEVYVPPMRPGHYDYCEAGIEALRERRRSYATAEQELVEAQKRVASRGDRDGARYLKEEKRRFQRQIKASNIWLNWLLIERGSTAIVGWPVELASELDAEIGAYELAASGQGYNQ